MALVRNGILLSILGVFAVGCGGSTSSTNGTATAEAGEAAPSSKPNEASTESGRDTTETESQPANRIATCTLKGKGEANVTIEYSDQGFDLTFQGQPVPATGTALYSATVFDKTGEYGDQLGVKYLNGRQIAFFIFPLDGSSGQTNLDGEAVVNGDTLSASFPAVDLGPLADAGPASWSATFSVEGNDIGMCPGGIDSLPFPAS